MSLDVFDPAALIATLPGLVPADTTLSSPQDGIAALLHTAMNALAFRLIAVDDASSSTSALTVLPDTWNKAGPSHYMFKYKHDQSSLVFVLTISKLGGRTLINAIALESDKAASLDIATDDFTSPSFYPHRLGGAPLIQGFISSNRVADLMSQFKLKIIQKLVPGLRKDGYTEGEQTTTVTANVATSSQPSAPRYQPPPLPPRVGPRNPLEIGRRDLDPFPANPFSPPSLFPDHNGDGMFVGPGHPLFAGRRDGQGPWGGDGFLPPMGAPPGARFDPVGPAFPRGGFGPGRLPRRGLGEPDNDDFLPPGNNNDMYM
ncbi:PI31 proteasome regulator N-terminal-domain-containing protein [Mycena amicta]|nr:PI31 proteasome regulator N-terminal-domain-containing protein [Mycena amicta]